MARMNQAGDVPSMDEVEVRSAAPVAVGRSTWVKVLVGVVALLILTGMAVWRVGAALDESYGCPSQEWAVALGAEVQRLLPADGGSSPSVSDCDDRRAVQLEAVGLDVTADAVRRAALRNGWSETADVTCLEKEFEGLAATLQIAEVTENHVRVAALRGSC